jgi:hypothetical protein
MCLLRGELVVTSKTGSWLTPTWFETRCQTEDTADQWKKLGALCPWQGRPRSVGERQRNGHDGMSAQTSFVGKVRWGQARISGASHGPRRKAVCSAGRALRPGKPWAKIACQPRESQRGKMVQNGVKVRSLSWTTGTVQSREHGGHVNPRVACPLQKDLFGRGDRVWLQYMTGIMRPNQ